MRKFVPGALVALMLGAGAAHANEGVALPVQDWSFKGLFGKFDQAALKRGFQVYAEVCANCHSLKLVAYRNLAAIGLPEGQIREYAATKSVQDGPNDAGEMFTRPALPSDRFVSPFANEKAARAANGGAYPPDLSLMVKARKGGPDYLFGILTGFKDQPPEEFLKAWKEHHEGADFKMMDGMQFNEYFPGNQIGMPPPLSEGSVTYADGTQATVAQMSRDVTAFLAWTASPEMDHRKALGMKVLLFVAVLTAMLYAVKRKIWSNLH